MFTDTAELKSRDRNYIYNSHTMTNPIVIYGSSPIKVRSAAMIKSDWLKDVDENKHTTLSEHVQRPIEKYHTVGTCPTSISQIPHCRNMSKVQ